MAKKKSAKGSGPHLAVAVFCERLLQEKDGVPSLMRMVDVLTVRKPPDPMPLGTDGLPMRPMTTTTVVIVFKSGDAKGERVLRIDAESPSGEVKRGPENTVHFLGDEKGINLHGEVPVDISEEGLYWFDVFMDDQRVTRMPLRIVYQKPPETQTTPPADSPGKDSPPPKDQESGQRDRRSEK